MDWLVRRNVSIISSSFLLAKLQEEDAILVRNHNHRKHLQLSMCVYFLELELYYMSTLCPEMCVFFF